MSTRQIITDIDAVYTVTCSAGNNCLLLRYFIHPFEGLWFGYCPKILLKDLKYIIWHS